MARVETSHEENEHSAMVQGNRKGRKQRERERERGRGIGEQARGKERKSRKGVE